MTQALSARKDFLSVLDFDAPDLEHCLEIAAQVKADRGLGRLAPTSETLNGRLLLYDALSMETRQVRIRRDPNCVVCGDHPTVTSLIDYDEFCGTAPAWTEG